MKKRATLLAIAAAAFLAAQGTRRCYGGQAAAAGPDHLDLDANPKEILSGLTGRGSFGVPAVSRAAVEDPARAEAALSEARDAVARSATDKGFYAGNDYRQFWTRDLGYSADVLLSLGYADAVEAQLLEILKHQRPSGEIPAMVQTKEGVLHDMNPALLVRTFQYRGSYVLDHFREFASNFHGGEADNPLIFLVTVKTFERRTGRKTFSEKHRARIDRALARVEAMTDGGGMIRGSAWFDAMVNYNGQYTLHNQVWLHKMYDAYGLREKAQRTQGALEAFWNPVLGYYADVRGGDHFDTLSNAMLLEEGLVPQERVPSVLEMLREVRTPYGYLDLYPTYPQSECSQYPHQYQNSTVWPFVELHIAKAFVKYGLTEEARRIKSLMESRRGVNEWYSPIDGKPGGSKNQLWTACAYLGVSDLLGE